MIEEAAGTKLYESKKESAQKTIEKKDAKLKEIDTVSASLHNFPTNDPLRIEMYNKFLDIKQENQVMCEHCTKVSKP